MKYPPEGITPDWIRKVLRKNGHHVKVEVTVENLEYWIWFKVDGEPLFAMIRGSIEEVLEIAGKGKQRFPEGTVKWKPHDVSFSEEAREHRRIVRHRFTKEELSRLKVSDLKEVARVKGLSPSGNKTELIDRCYGFDHK